MPRGTGRRVCKPMDAFITDLSFFLPGKAVDNTAIERYLGSVDRLAARTRKMILASNGIERRHYAIDPESGAATHSNAQLAAAAVQGLRLWGDAASPAIDCLCCGTSSPDQLMPGHASMVHGELGMGPCEVVSTAGICLSGITALKYAAMSVALGQAKRAVATGSELASSFMRSDFFNSAACEAAADEAAEERYPAFSFEENFLRWMLSDGAGAMLLEPAPADGLTLQIEWIEIVSQAHRLEACMYAGCTKRENGSLVGWREHMRCGEDKKGRIFTVKQDARLLNREVLPTLVGDVLPLLAQKYGLRPEEVDWFLPHYSSEYFRPLLHEQLRKSGFSIPLSRWYTNLRERGNTGSASFYIMLAELCQSGRLSRGEKILGFIPESGRFSVGYILFTVV